MDIGQRPDTPLPLTVPPVSALLPAVPPHQRIAIPLSQVLDFARHDTDSQPSRQLAGALRPLLAVALATAGFCQGLPPELPVQKRPRRPAPAGSPSGSGADDATAEPEAAVSLAKDAGAVLHNRPISAGAAAVPAGAGGDPEILFTALSSLVEVVKSLTPSAGRIYAHLGHEAVESDDASPFDEHTGHSAHPERPDALDDQEHLADSAGDDSDSDADSGAHSLSPSDHAFDAQARPALAADNAINPLPRSEVIIELVSIASPAYESLSPAIHNALGALAFELAVVAAILESKGGQLHLAAPGAQSRRFVVRLPVWKH